MGNIITPKMFGQQLNLGHWPTDRLIGFWRFIEAGNLVDESFFGNHGTITGATWEGDSLSFNGSSDYVDVGSLGSFGLSNGRAQMLQGLSLIVRFRTTDTNQQALCGNIPTGSGSPNMSLYINTNLFGNQATGFIRFQWRQSSSFGIRYLSEQDNGFTDGQWHTLSITSILNTANGCRMWLDGNEITGLNAETNTFSGAQSWSLAGGLYFGAENNNGTDQNHCAGNISFSVLYSRVLSSSEIQQLFINPNLPIHQYPVWMGTGAVAAAGLSGIYYRTLLQGVS